MNGSESCSETGLNCPITDEDMLQIGNNNNNFASRNFPPLPGIDHQVKIAFILLFTIIRTLPSTIIFIRPFYHFMPCSGFTRNKKIYTKNHQGLITNVTIIFGHSSHVIINLQDTNHFTLFIDFIKSWIP